MKITLVAGARPNFMKIAPIIEALEEQRQKGKALNWRLIHTGQHYDKNLSQTFFEELEISKPHINLNVMSGTQSEQTGALMVAFENELISNPADLVLVVGDVTSTLACAIVAKKAGSKVAHVEAGIRSGDMRMPEEINRIVTDSLTDYFFTTSEYANENLRISGVSSEAIFYVGNVMIDTLLKNRSRFKKPGLWKDLKLENKKFFMLTLHRPSNVDEAQNLKHLVEAICSHAKEFIVIFPVHPRTQNVMAELNINASNLHLVDPLGYLEFNYLVERSKCVLTDSGGITEEATIMNVPCITLRENTERPETCEIGTNILVGNDLGKLEAAFDLLNAGGWKEGTAPDLWDGLAAKRIARHLVTIFNL